MTVKLQCLPGCTMPRVRRLRISGWKNEERSGSKSRRGSHMRIRWSSVLAIAVIGTSTAIALAQRGPAVPQMRGDGPPPEAKPFSITRLDAALDAIISPDAKLVELARGFGLTEGGLWIADGNSGYWIFAGLLDNVIYKVTPDRKVSVFMEKAGYTGNDPDHTGAQTRAGRSHVLLIGPSCTG